MSRLPRINGRRAIRALERAGFVVVRIRGSHHFMRHQDDRSRWATVSFHGRGIISLQVMANILETSGLTAREFRQYL